MLQQSCRLLQAFATRTYFILLHMKPHLYTYPILSVHFLSELAMRRYFKLSDDDVILCYCVAIFDRSQWTKSKLSIQLCQWLYHVVTAAVMTLQFTVGVNSHSVCPPSRVDRL